jgi:hypothetical protein
VPCASQGEHASSCKRAAQQVCRIRCVRGSLSSRGCGCIDRALWLRERNVLIEHSPARKVRLCDQFVRQSQLLKGELRAMLGSCDYFPEHEPLHRSV